MISNAQIVWKSLRNALNFRSILFLCNNQLCEMTLQWKTGLVKNVKTGYSKQSMFGVTFILIL